MLLHLQRGVGITSINESPILIQIAMGFPAHTVIRMSWLSMLVCGFAKAVSLAAFVPALNAECLLPSVSSTVLLLLTCGSSFVPGQTREHKRETKMWKTGIYERAFASVKELFSPLLVLGCCRNGEQESE